MLRNSAFGFVKFWTHANTTKKHKFFLKKKYIYMLILVWEFFILFYTDITNCQNC